MKQKPILIIDEIPAPNPYDTDSDIYRINDLCRLSVEDKYDIINTQLTRRKIEFIKIVTSENWQKRYEKIFNIKPGKKEDLINTIIRRISERWTTNKEEETVFDEEKVKYLMCDALGFDCK